MAISKLRLEELIKQEAKIWSRTWNEEVYLNYKCKIKPYKKQDNGKVVEYVVYVYEDEEHTNRYLLSGLEEDVEKGKWDYEFGNIQRAEKLCLPTWEEFDYDTEFNFVDSKGYEWDLYSPDKKRISLVNNNFEHFEFEYSKENYTKACKLAKKLFLGEINE